MDTIFFNTICFQYDLDMLQGKFKLVKTLVFCLLRDAAVAAN